MNIKKMIIKNLANTDFTRIMNCFNLAFEGYFVPMPTSGEFWKERWEYAKVDFSLSYGMFDEEKLVGFIIHAIDNRNGSMIAFNTGTGVIPSYRGRGITQSIYRYALPKLKEHGVSICRLEVIRENKKAINLYQNIGFRIIKNYECYQGGIKHSDTRGVNVQEVNYLDIYNIAWNDQTKYSWDNHLNVIKGNNNFKYYKILFRGKEESFFIINSTNGYIPQFAVINDSLDGYKRLFCGIKGIAKSIKVNNIDDRLTSRIQIMQYIGLDNVVNQYEMQLEI